MTTCTTRAQASAAITVIAPWPVTTLCHDTINGVRIHRPKIHESAFARIHRGQVAYGPVGILLAYDLVLRDGTIVPGPCEAETNAHGETRIVPTQTEGEPASKTCKMAIEHSCAPHE